MTVLYVLIGIAAFCVLMAVISGNQYEDVKTKTRRSHDWNWDGFMLFRLLGDLGVFWVLGWVIVIFVVAAIASIAWHMFC